MANGKFILLFIICASVLSVVISFACSIGGSQCNEQIDNTFIIKYFILTPSQNLFNYGGEGLALNETFRGGIESLVQEKAGVSATDVAAIFLDSLKMVLGFLTLLTPFPILDFMASLGMPLYIVVLFAIPLFMLYIVSIMEFIRGVEF
jgi:hypothetical protein